MSWSWSSIKRWRQSPVVGIYVHLLLLLARSMRPTATIRRVHTPLIHFLGKRAPPTHAHEPAPHPAAPKDVASHFSDFLRKLSSAPPKPQSGQGKAQGGSGSALEWWQAPPRLVQSAVPVTDAEIDAVISGGASTLRR